MKTKGDTRRKNANWALAAYPEPPGIDGAQLAVLMDIRDELQQLVGLLGCKNAVDIPNILRRIDVNTTKRKHTKRKSG